MIFYKTTSAHSATKVAVCLLLLASVSFVNSAEILLKNRGKITGDVLTIASTGKILVRSELSEDLLQVADEEVHTIQFSEEGDHASQDDTLVSLINGDVLPATEITLSEERFSLGSEVLGNLEVRRDLIRSIEVDSSEPRVVYEHPRSSVGWKMDSGSREHWRFSEGQFVSVGEGSIAREMKFEDRFGLRMLVGWVDEPNFEISLCSDLKVTESEDCYVLRYGEEGLELSRRDGENELPLLTLDRPPSRYPGRTFELEVLVDPTSKRIALYVDGELEGKVTDPTGKVPDGRAVRFENLASPGNEFSVRDFEGFEWEVEKDFFAPTNVYVGAADRVIDRFGDSLVGKIIEIANGEEGGELSLAVEDHGGVISIGMNEISGIFFRKTKAAGKTEPRKGLELRVLGGGKMQIDSCVFEADKIRAVHPLIGATELPRKAVYKMTKSVLKGKGAK